MFDTLKEYGFSARFEAEAAMYPELFPGRVISETKGIYSVVSEKGELLAVISGKLRYAAMGAADLPAAGDFVMLDRETDEGGNAVIHRVLQRKSAFVRRASGPVPEEQVAAANVDTVFICMSLNDNFNLRRLERYLAACYDSGATPVVVLTKADLCPDAEEKKFAAEGVAIGADVLAVSAFEDGGWLEVAKYIKEGMTAAFMGSSGVGKSTLINRLLGEEKLETQGIGFLDKGRHTTTRRELMLLPGGGLVMDTPGMRELGMWDSSEGVERAFADVEALVSACRFADCTHTKEPGCAVRAAIGRGELAEDRWASYLRLRDESAASGEISREEMLRRKTAKFKEISKINKHNKKK